MVIIMIIILTIYRINTNNNSDNTKTIPFKGVLCKLVSCTLVLREVCPLKLYKLIK